ncbi:hypothetical protein GCM10009754_05180 [Amycolatopsis minnesotensis]|uniref:Uncharacterized protein n=1 Tax=Amycolatopsis minnesotensis TaxID=337894 RepID=A0ABN2Q3N4_9PSEU
MPRAREGGNGDRVPVAGERCQVAEAEHVGDPEEDRELRCLEAAALHGLDPFRRFADQPAEDNAGHACPIAVLPDASADRLLVTRLRDHRITLVLEFLRMLVHCSDDGWLNESLDHPAAAIKTGSVPLRPRFRVRSGLDPDVRSAR